MAVMVELDDATRAEQLARLDPWLATTSLLQSTLCKELERLAEGVAEPHARRWLEGARDAAREDERQIGPLYRAFGRRPGPRETVTSVAATARATVREAVGHVEGLAGGARGASWRRLRVVLLTNVDAMGAWGVCETLGLALGVPQAVEIAVPTAARRAKDHVLLQELFLEMAANAIIYHRDI
jgi:hypothetical protein